MRFQRLIEKRKEMMDMDVLFENTHVRSKEVISQYYQFYYYNSKRDLAVRLGFYGLLLLSTFTLQFWIYIILFVVFLFRLARMITYWAKVSATFNAETRANGKPIEVHTVVRENCFENTLPSGLVTKVEFSEITSVHKTGNLILLKSKSNIFYILGKNTFTTGNEAEFIHFLESKGIPCKYRW